MKRLYLTLSRSFIILLLAITVTQDNARAETFVGSNVDSRVTLAFKVSDTAAQAWLPEGWTLAPFGGGAIAGSNLLLVFVDRQLGLDPEGKTATNAIYRAIALVSSATRDGETRAFVTRVYVSDPTENPYSNSVGVNVVRNVAISGNGSDPASGSDDWAIEDDDGGTLVFRMSYEGAIPGWSEGESLPYSSIEPDFHRIYRYEQIADLLHSVPAGVDRISAFEFTTTIAELAPMFDGSEELVAVINVPWYLRHLYLP